MAGREKFLVLHRFQCGFVPWPFLSWITIVLHLIVQMVINWLEPDMAGQAFLVRRILCLFKAPTTASLTQFLSAFVTEEVYYKVRSDFHLLKQPGGQWLASTTWNKINFEDSYWISVATVIGLVCCCLGIILRLNKTYPKAPNNGKKGDGQTICKYLPLGLSLCPQCHLSAVPTAYC